MTAGRHHSHILLIMPRGTHARTACNDGVHCGRLFAAAHPRDKKKLHVPRIWYMQPRKSNKSPEGGRLVYYQ
jgi:hypothetical protein